MRALCSKYNISITKSKGQNFLVDSGITEKIVRRSGIGGNCGVLEVGPGLGALTRELCRVAGRVTAVELDARLLPALRETLAGATRQGSGVPTPQQQQAMCDVGNIDIVHGDVLRLDITGLVREKMPGLEYHVCSNLPYNITTPALSALIEAGIFKTITVMVQKEVAALICAVPGTPEYGAFTIYARYHTEPVTLFDVPPDCFIPRPKVMSSVLTMNIREKKLLSVEEERYLFKIVRASFGQRRKTLVNALHSAFGEHITKAGLTGIVQSCGYDAMVRGETLDLDGFIKLTSVMNLLGTVK